MENKNCGNCVYFIEDGVALYTGHCIQSLQCISSPGDACLSQMEVPTEGFYCSEYLALAQEDI
jgi:hypothetical protein